MYKCVCECLSVDGECTCSCITLHGSVCVRECVCLCMYVSMLLRV